MGPFTGWPAQAFDVLLELDGDPPPVVRESLREKREQLVRQPMIALMQQLADIDPVYSNFTVPGFRTMIEPWQRQLGFVRPENNLYLKVWFDRDGLSVQGSWVMFNPGSYTCPWRETYLSAVDDDTTGTELVGIIETLGARGFKVTGELGKRVPKAYPGDHPRARLLRDAGHPRAELLRHRTLIAGRHLGCEEWLHTPAALDRVQAAFEELRPMMAWFAHHAAAWSWTP